MSGVDPDRQRALRDLYAAFNRRDTAVVVAAMAPDVVWPNGWEGGVVRGRDAIRDYWTRQWAVVDPVVEPTGFALEPDGRVAVAVRQVVRDRSGDLLSDGTVVHVYAFGDEGLVTGMEIVDGPWRGHAYARSSAHHRAADDWFLDRHRPRPDDVVVDLGCGSGGFTARLAALVPEGRVVGVDSSRSMLDEARATVTAPNVEFVEAPAEEVDRALPPESADLVVSRAMLHWLPCTAYERVFRAVLAVLRPGGWYHSESAGPGNVGPLSDAVGAVATRLGLPVEPRPPDTGRVFDAVEAAGFEIPVEGVRTVAQRRAFTREELRGVVATQPAVAITRQLDDPARAAQAVRLLQESVDGMRRADGSYDQTFVRHVVLVRKPVRPA
jgi:SAM-dependent methyltransferase/nuclear transport factor 2 (NTF2) superfamily protein